MTVTGSPASNPALLTRLNSRLRPRRSTRTVRSYLDTHAEAADPWKYLVPARDAVAAEVARLLDVLARPGR